MSFSETYLEEVGKVAESIDPDQLEDMANRLAAVRERNGRLFILGVGGGAGHASHAVNDFRKICGFECYAPTDNVSELTARTNDEGWETSFVEWLRTSRLGSNDAIMVFSVGGGSREHNVSMNLVHAVEEAKAVGATVCGIVGKSTGTTAQMADICIVIHAPKYRVTPHVESFQAVLWHLLVTHPALAEKPGTWEAIANDTIAQA